MKITKKRNYDFEYRYSIYNPKTVIWEREPNRHLKLFFDTIKDNSEIERN